MDFTLHDPDSAPEASRPLLKDAERQFGMIPNLERVLAECPPLLRLYVTGEGELEDEEKMSLSKVELHVVMQQANVENNCVYCVPWHTILSKNAGVPDEVREAQRNDRPLDDPRLETLRSFARSLIHHRGRPPQPHVQAMRDAGYDNRQMLEVVMRLAINTVSNFINGIALTPLDEAPQQHAWTKPWTTGHDPKTV